MKQTILLAVLLAALCSASAASAVLGSQGRWRIAVERAYLANCNATSHGAAAKCKCTLRILENRYTEAQMANLYLRHQQRLLAIMRQTVLSCS